MKHFYLSAHALSPLAIRADYAAGGVKAIQYITGTTLLGSLAEAHRLLRPEKNDEFEAFFLQERVQFPHLYPALFRTSPISGIAGSNMPVLPLPKTAQSCKRFPGFCPLLDEAADEERHGIRDSLLDWATFALLDSPGQPLEALLAPFELHKHCSYKRPGQQEGCQQVMEHVSGYYRRGTNASQRMKAKTPTRLQMHTGINHEWGTVEESILYSREVFEQGMPFWGDVILPDELAQTFKEFIAEVVDEEVIHMGTGRTRGMGKVLLKLDEEVPSEDHTVFKERLLEFDRALKKRTGEAESSATCYFVITLHSASILRDPFLRYYSTIDATLLHTLLSPYLTQEYPAHIWRGIYQAVGTQRVSGWNALWGTPRTIDYALEAGSTFVFSCAHELDDMLIQALRALEEEGIGRRRAEGFGRIRISDPFHLEGEQA